MLHICEEELNYLDMAISNKKSCYIRIGSSRECVSLYALLLVLLLLGLERSGILAFLSKLHNYVFKCSLVNARKC